MSIHPDTVILLAAGMGVRLGELGEGMPKALFHVAGRRLVDYALDFARAMQPARRVVVGGFRHDAVSAHVAARREVDVEIFENTEFRIGNLRTVETGLAQVERGGFLVMNIDHIYPAAVADRIRAMDGANITAMVDFDRQLTADDMKVKLDGARRVAHISKQLADWDCGYVGMTFVPEAKVARYRAGVDAARARHGDKAVAEQVLAQLAEEGEPVDIGDISGIGWHEVDTPEDSAKAEAALQK